MTKTKKGDTCPNANANTNHIVTSHLSIQRCRQYITHLHVIMHMCNPKNVGLDDVAAHNAWQLMVKLDKELENSSEALVKAKSLQHS